MTTLLRVDASVRLNGSVSRALADSAEAAWRAEHPDGVVVRRDLGRDPLPATAWPALAKAALGEEPATEAEQRLLAEARELAAEVIAELKNADAVLLAVPLYNYGISQHVKTWIDLLLLDRTFLQHPTPVEGRPAIFTLARGGGYSPGTPKHGWDHATRYLERIFGDVFGMNDPDRRRRAHPGPGHAGHGGADRPVQGLRVRGARRGRGARRRGREGTDRQGRLTAGPADAMPC